MVNMAISLGGIFEYHPHPIITGHCSVYTNEQALRIGGEGINKVGKILKAKGCI